MANSNVANDAVLKVLEMVRPEIMDKETAKEVLEDVIGQLEASVEALEDEIENDKEEDDGTES